MKNKRIKGYGQYMVWDICLSDNDRLTGYRFQRYVGQKVFLYRTGEPDIEGTITKIEPYYTTVVDSKGYEWAGTPTSCRPADKKEYNKFI